MSAAQQRARDARLEAANRHAQRCQHRHGGGRCDAPLETTIGEFGRTVVVCPACERRKRGVCRDCPRPVEGTIGKAVRCARHKEIARNEQFRASEERHKEKRLEHSRRYYQDNEEVRRRRNEYKREWRKAHPEQVRAQKKRYVERHRDNPNSARSRYFARYRKRHGAYYRELQATKDAERRAQRPIPPCSDCGKPTGWTWVPGRTGRPWLTCMKCCWPHQRKKRRRTMRELQKQIAADPRFGLPPKPVVVRKPRTVATRGPGGERLCISPDCDIVVTHRKKKCTKCQRRDAAIASEKLAAHHGRGRRTDLEHVA